MCCGADASAVGSFAMFPRPGLSGPEVKRFKIVTKTT